MEMIETIPVSKVKESGLSKVNWNELAFGNYIADHMVYGQYKNGEWQRPSIVPFGNLTLSPAALALHYGQSVFEGMKAFRLEDGSINIFRLDKHFERLNKSLKRMGMPPIPYDLFVNSVQQLVIVDKGWVPTPEGSSLYIRPLVFASEARFGVKISDEYTYIVFSGPVGPYFQKPLRLKIERHYSRAGKGGTGSAKCAGNYGGAFYPTQLAKNEGFDQVIWTDASQHEYIEESGMMNIMFVIDGVLTTPPLSDSILDGITRDSFLQLADELGIPHQERPISVKELMDAFQHNRVSEAFGAGTAAVVAPISIINIDGRDYEIPAYNDNNIMFRLKKKLESIRYGHEEDVFHWNNIVK